jgi:hypothetical protein
MRRTPDLDKRVENAEGVAAPADAGDDRLREAAGELEHLRPSLAADHRLELPHHQRIRMRPQHRTEQVVRVADVGHPVAHRLVDGVLQRTAAGVDGAHLGAQQTHAKHVERLPLHVLDAHVDVTVEPEQRAGRGSRDPVLPCSGFGHDPALAHPDRQQRLPERVVDLVSTRVGEVFALQEDARPPGGRRQPRCFMNGRGAADVVLQQAVELRMKTSIFARGEVRAPKLLDRLDQRLWGNRAELAEIARASDRAAALYNEVMSCLRVFAFSWRYRRGLPGRGSPRTAPQGAADP